MGEGGGNGGISSQAMGRCAAAGSIRVEGSRGRKEGREDQKEEAWNIDRITDLPNEGPFFASIDISVELNIPPGRNLISFSSSRPLGSSPGFLPYILT